MMWSYPFLAAIKTAIFGGCWSSPKSFGDSLSLNSPWPSSFAAVIVFIVRLYNFFGPGNGSPSATNVVIIIIIIVVVVLVIKFSIP